jgi:hypothetical protein
MVELSSRTIEVHTLTLLMLLKFILLLCWELSSTGLYKPIPAQSFIGLPNFQSFSCRCDIKASILRSNHISHWITTSTQQTDVWMNVAWSGATIVPATCRGERFGYRALLTIDGCFHRERKQQNGENLAPYNTSPTCDRVCFSCQLWLFAALVVFSLIWLSSDNHK